MKGLPPRLRPLWPYGKIVYTGLTGTVSPVRRRRDARHDGWLPHTIARSTAVAVAASGGRVEQVAPGGTVDREPPRGAPAATVTQARQFRRRTATFAPSRVLELPGGRVLGPARALITRDGALLHDEVRYFGTRYGGQHPVFWERHVGPPREVDQLTVLATRGDANYYHFLHDVLPRLDVLERSSRPAPDRYYAPRTTRFQRELLALMGLGEECIVDADAVPHVRAGQLTVPTLPDLDLGHPQWATDFLRARLLPARPTPDLDGCLYVTRGRARHTRSVRNEDEVVAALAPFGVRVIDPGAMTVAEQIEAFAGARLIVAPHGAALANLVFARPGAAVVELFAPDFVQGCYWKLSTTVPGLRYRYSVGLGRSSRLRDERGVASDITVDLPALLRLLGDLG